MHNAWEMRWIARDVGLMHWSEWDGALEKDEGVRLPRLSPNRAGCADAKRRTIGGEGKKKNSGVVRMSQSIWPSSLPAHSSPR